MKFMAMELAGHDEAVLRLEFETERLIPSAEVGAIFSELDGAFQRFVRGRSRRLNLRLAVRKLEVGSLIADFVIVASGVVMGLHKIRSFYQRS